MGTDLKTVLALSSEVGVGAVGLSIARFAFAVNKVSAICLPTVFFATRPDMGRVVRNDISSKALAGQLAALTADGRFAGLDGVMTGYFATVEQVEVAARQMEALKAETPELVVLVDPVLGDHDSGLYVSREVAEAVRDLLVPQADVITPNRYEFLWLAGADVADGGRSPGWPDDVAGLAARLGDKHIVGAKHVVVTSAHVVMARADGGAAEGQKDGTPEGEISTILLAGGEPHIFTAPYYKAMPKGTGDVFAAYMLGRLLRGDDMVTATQNSAAYLAMVAEKARGCEAIEPFLLFQSEQD